MPAALITSLAGTKLYVCSTAQNVDLNAAAYAALTWVQVSNVGSFGQAGETTNILKYDTWDSIVMQKSKGLPDAGDPEIEVSRVSGNAGQVILRTAAKDNNNYAFKILFDDAITTTGTIIYMRGLVTGPQRSYGRAEDFQLEVFKLALNQREVVVAAV